MYIYNNKGQCIGEIYDNNDNDNEASTTTYTPDWQSNIAKGMRYWCVSAKGLANFSYAKPVLLDKHWLWGIKDEMRPDKEYSPDKYENHLQWQDSLLQHSETEGENENEEQPHMSVLEYVPSWDKHPTMHYWCISENGVARYSRDMPHIVGNAWEANWAERDVDFEEAKSKYNDYGEIWQTILLQSPKGYCPNWRKYGERYNYWAIDKDKEDEAYYYSSKPYYDAARKVWNENKEDMQCFPMKDLEYPKAEEDFQALAWDFCGGGFLTNPNEE